MQSLQSSCQEADFIINDTLEKLKGSNNNLNNTSLVASSATTTSSLATTSGLTQTGHHSVTILRPAQQAQQLSYQHAVTIQPQQQQQQHNATQNKYQQQYHHLQNALQGSTTCSNAVVVAQQLSPPPSSPSLISTGYSGSFTSKSSLKDTSLLHCNISQIPSQPPLYIFDGDGDDETNPPDQPPAELLAPVADENISNTTSSNIPSAGSIRLESFSLLSSQKYRNGSNNNNINSNMVVMPAPSPAPSMASLNNYNSITSPSPTVPDLLLSTPPGASAAAAVAPATTSIFYSNKHHNNNNSSNNNNNKNNKKSDKRPSSTSIPSSGSTNSNNNNSFHHSQYHHNHIQTTITTLGTTQQQQQQQQISYSTLHQANASLTSTSTALSLSPTSSPSKRQKIKDYTSTLTSGKLSLNAANRHMVNMPTSSSVTNSNKRSDLSASLSQGGNLASYNSGSNSAVNISSAHSSSSTSASSSQRFINIHQAIKEQYVQLLANDLNVFASTGLKHRSRSFVLERVVQCEKLNTIVVNLYPGNKGYALAIHYDERHQLTAESESGSLHSLSCGGCGSGVSHYSEAIQLNTLSLHKNITSRPFTAGSHKILHPSSNDLKGVGVDGDSKFETQEYALVEILRWPYENDQLLQCIDQEILPDFVMDLLTAPTVTLPALHDDTMATERIYRKPNVFYCGCVVAEVRDFRQTFTTSTNICDTRHVLLRPTNASLYADIQFLATSLNEKTNAAANTVTVAASSTACAPEDKLSLESHMVLATAEPLCLDPDPTIGHQAINSQHERQIFNSHEMRRQMKKFTQIAINRKRKLDQFTHHYGLELYDYLTRLRSRPRSGGCAVAVNNAAANLLTNTNSFASKVPKRPHDIIRPISPPRLDYPPNLKVPDKQQLDLIEKYAKTNERLRETTDCHPILIEEYILETEREDNEGHRVIYRIKLSIFQRPSNSQYLGELYVDRDYREGEVNGESCSFPLGTRIHANRYIQQFTEIFTEEGRKAVKITHLVPGHLPKVTHTGITPEQRHALLLQQQQQLQLQQRQAALLAVQQQQQQQQQQQIIQVNALASHQQHQQQQTQQHVVVVGPNGQQQHLLSATVHHVSSNSTTPQIPTPSTHQHQHLPQQQHQQHLTKNINIVGITGHSAAAVQQVLRQHQQQQQQQQSQITATQYIEANGNSGGGGQTPISNVQITTHSHTSGGSAPHIQLQQIATNQGNNVPGSVAASTNTTTTTHQLSLSNGSLVLVQHHPTTNTGQTQATISQQAHQVLQHAGITIQPATTPHHAQQQQHLQQKTHIINATQLSALPATPSAGNSALRTQLSSNVPILQAQLKSAPIVTTATQQHHQQQPQQQHLLHKQQQGTTVHVTTTGNNTTTTLHSNPAINAIVTSIMNTANQWQQQHQQQQQQQKNSLSTNTSSTTTTTTLKSSNNASILSLLNSAPAAMTSTPVASSTFTATTGQTQTQQQQPSQQHPQSQQQQTVTLVQHAGQQTATLVNTDSFIQQTAPLRKSQNEVLQNLLNPGRKINIVSSGGGGVNVGGSATATFRTNAAGNLIAVNLNQVPQQQHQQQLHHHHSQQQESSQPQPPPPPPPSQTTVRVSMSALASQLASPPAIMTNSTNFGSYTLSTVSGGSGGNVSGGAGGNGSIKILNSGIQQQRVLANALRRDSLNAQQQVPPNAIVVGMAAPSPGSDSNASNASSGFAIPQAATSNIINNNNSSSNSTTLNALLANAATPSPSGSDHSQSSQTQNQTLLERLNSSGVVSAGACTVLPTNISPQQQHNSSQQTTQYITKTLVPSPATLSIHSPMSSPHPQSSPSPHLQQQQQQTSNQPATATATLNLQGINFSTLQGAMANFQNVQVQIPGFTQPISLQLTAGGGLQPQSGNATVSVVATGGPGPNNNNVSGAVSNLQQNSTQTHPTQARSLLVSVPVSNAQQQQQQPQQQLQHSSQQTQHTITLQPHQVHQVHQQHSSTANATNAGSSTIVNLPAGAVATATGATQTVLLANNSGGNVGLTSAGGNTPGGASGGSGTTMLTLPIAQLVGAAGVQKLNTPTLRTSNATGASVVTSVVNTSTTTTGGGGVGGGSSIILQQQSAPPTTNQQTISNATQQATITVTGPGGNTISHHNQAIQLVGTIQQGGRNIQVVGTKQLAGSRHLIAQRQIGNSTLKIAAATPIQAGTNAAINSATTNLTATPIVMSAQKLQLKAIKPGSSTTTTTQQQQQQQQQQLQQTHPTTHQRLLNQITASQASQTTPQDMQQQQQQLTHTVQQQQQQQGINKTQTVIMGQPQNGSGNTTHTLSTIRAASNLSQRAITAIVAAANRRRSATDVNK